MKEKINFRGPGLEGRSRRGFSLIVYASSLTFLTAVMGLGIDAGTVYLIKASLSSAADAAALAAGRSVNLGNNVSEANDQATTTARKMLAANFPDGFMNTHLNLAGDVSAAFQLLEDEGGNPNGVLQVSVEAHVHAPTYFMRIFNVDSVPIRARGVSTRKSLVMVLILDKSSSMGTRNSPVGTMPTGLGTSPCEAMVYSANEFINMFSPYDWVGLVGFNSTGTVEYVPSQNFKLYGAGGMRIKLANIQCGGNTNTTSGLELAYQEILNADKPLALNSIVLFTDGMPNGVNADFPIRQAVDTRLGPAQNVNAGNPPNVPPGNRANCLANGTQTCINMPVQCPAAGVQPPVRGNIAQWSGYAANGGGRSNVMKSLSTDGNPTFPAGCPTASSVVTSQTIAFIPQLDRWGNRTWGLAPPFRDNWIYRVNVKCAPAGTPVSPWVTDPCYETGGVWADYPLVGPPNGAGGRINSNFFPAGNPYAGQLRPDMPNSIGVGSMNSAVDAANKIRANTTYNIILSSMMMLANNDDPVDREFLPIVANLPEIPPILIDPAAVPIVNPYYQPTQQTGVYVQIINIYDFVGAFMQLASSLLRLSQ